MHKNSLTERLDTLLEKPEGPFTVQEMFFLLHFDLEGYVVQRRMTKNASQKQLKANKDQLLNNVFLQALEAIKDQTRNFLYDVIQQMDWAHDSFNDEARQIDHTSPAYNTISGLGKIVASIDSLKEHAYDFIDKYNSWLQESPLTDKLTFYEKKKHYYTRNGASKKAGRSRLVDLYKPNVVKELASFVQQKPIDYRRFENPSRYEDMKKDVLCLEKEFDSIYDEVYALYRHDSMDFIALESNFGSATTLSDAPLIKDLLFQLKYGLSTFFNFEYILAFVFTGFSKDKLSDDNDLGTIVHKHENLFNEMYTMILKDYPDISELFAGSAQAALNYRREEIFTLQPKHFASKNLSYIDLKRVLILYASLFENNSHIKRAEYSKSLRISVDFYNKILPYTRLNWKFFITPERIVKNLQNEANITNKEFAELLGIDPTTYYRNKENGTLFQKPGRMWILEALTGYCADYLSGMTTFPLYGRNPYTFDKRYLIHPVILSSFGHLILSRVRELTNFANDLVSSKNNQMIIKHKLSAKRERTISAKIIKITLLLQKQSDIVKSEMNKNNSIFTTNAANLTNQPDGVKKPADLSDEKYRALLDALDSFIHRLEKLDSVKKKS